MMAVYVDWLQTWIPTKRWPYKQFCHLMADTIDELHAFAVKLGLKRQWFQAKSSRPHYDLTAGKRRQAVHLGAVEVDMEWYRQQYKKKQGASMPKAAPIVENGKTIGHMIFCPACGCGHGFYNASAGKASKWTFNGDCENPTFSPSMLVKVGPYPTVNKDDPMCGKTTICHSFVRNGQIQYLNDCTHALAGQTIDLPDIEDES